MVDAPGRLGEDAAHRRPPGLGAERRLARRRAEHGRRLRGPAPDRRGRRAARHRSPRQLGRRGRSALRPLAVRLERGGGVDGRPGGAEAAQGRRRSVAARRDRRSRRRPRQGNATHADSSRTLRPISSSTSSRARCWRTWICRSASSSAPSVSSATRSRFAARPPMRARRRWPSDATRSQRPGCSRSRSTRSPSRAEASARWAASSRSPASSPRSSRPRSACSTSATSTRTSSPRCSNRRRTAAAKFAEQRNVAVDWERIWNIEPILFDDELIELADEAIKEVAGTSHRLPSGPLHDAAEVARAGIPTVMLFVQSLRGLSHTKLEDTKEEHLELSVQALDRLADRAVQWVAAR